ncbi:MAG: hypothetical protein ACKPKO_26205, partial [Candidatus Fonsibacter sp.]
DPQEQPGRDRHIQGLHGRLHADPVHPGIQRVRHLASYKPEESINNMSLYIVEASTFYLFFNKRYNL